MQRPEAGTVAEEDGAVEEGAEEVEASVTAEAKVVQWAVRVVVREVVQWAVRVVVREVVQWAVREVVREVVQWAVREVVREAFQPVSPRERLPPVLKARLVNRSPAPKEERGSRS